ncbi:MAG: LytTR family DNA-binding domain-containing protein [Bacteroidota bacterium]
MSERGNNSFFIKLASNYHQVPRADIGWLSAKGNYCLIHSVNNQNFKVKSSLVRLLLILGENEFVRTHKNYAVNIDKVEVYDPSGKIFIGADEIPLSRSYKTQFEEKLNFLFP